jgi:hypothetical protein
VALPIFSGKYSQSRLAIIRQSGKDLVRNGDFSDGMHRWFFSTDSHLAWHAKNWLFVV